MSSFYCESECSTPFVSAPSSPTKNSKNLYYYFSAPSSPPRSTSSPGAAPKFSLAECEFQFHSRFDSPRASNADEEILKVKKSAPQEHAEDDDDCVLGFYFSAPTSPDRRRARMKSAAPIWDEMPGTPKMIFGAQSDSPRISSQAAALAPDFEFSSSRISNSESIVSPQMSSADELFFKGQILPLKLRPRTNHHTWSGNSSSSAELTTSDSSGSSQTMGSSCSSTSAPQSPSKKANDAQSKAPASTGSARKSLLTLSPLHFFRKSSKNKHGSEASSKKKSASGRFRSTGRTLRELLHLSSVHKKSSVDPSSSSPEVATKATNPPKNGSSSSSIQSSSRVPSMDHHQAKRMTMERSLVGDYTRRFNNNHHHQQRMTMMHHRRRFHSGSILDLHYNSQYAPHNVLPESKQQQQQQGGGIIFGNHGAAARNIPSPAPPGISHGESGSSSGYSSKSSSGGGSKRFVNAAAAAAAVLAAAERSGAPSAASSRNVSPRRVRHVSSSYAKCTAPSSTEDLRRRTFLPYKQGLLGCLGCATMRIAGLSKSLHHASSAR